MRETRVAIYTRVSTPDQSLEGQDHELLEYAERRGWVVSKVYEFEKDVNLLGLRIDYSAGATVDMDRR
jgi:Resolvase, N terminal domain